MTASKKLVRFPSAEIEPELREFVDEVLVPILVRDALRDLAEEIRLASAGLAVANSPRSGNAR